MCIYIPYWLFPRDWGWDEGDATVVGPGSARRWAWAGGAVRPQGPHKWGLGPPAEAILGEGRGRYESRARARARARAIYNYIYVYNKWIMYIYVYIFIYVYIY